MKDNDQKVLEVLFSQPEYHFHIRELARKTALHPNTIITITNRLARDGIVKKRHYKHLVEVFCYLDSIGYKRRKKLFNITTVYDSGLIDSLINHYNHPSAIILFGSFSRGEDWSTSDIDIAIVTNNANPTDFSSFEKKLHRKIHLLTIRYKYISDEFYNNLINGIVLYGFLKDERLSTVHKRK